MTVQHDHGHDHDHDHGHDHGHTHPVREAQNASAGQGPPMLDIGGDIGALLLYTPADLVGAEIEVSLVAHPERRSHVEVLERHMNGQVIHVAVYGELPEGDYRLWDDSPGRQHEFTVVGGQVTELDWR